MLCKRNLSRHAVSVRMSARVSVTFVHAFCQNENKHIFRFFFTIWQQHHSNFSYQTSQQYSDGNPPPNGGVECKLGLLICPDAPLQRINFYTVSVTAHQHKKAIYCHSRFTRWRGYKKIIYKTVKPMNVRSSLLSQNKNK